MEVTPGGKYYDWILGEMSRTSLDHQYAGEIQIREAFKSLTTVMKGEECKRIIFDARQAMVFAEMNDGPEWTMRVKVQSPFSYFYCEFTDPLILPAQEPGYTDDAIAILFADANAVANPVMATFTLKNGQEHRVAIDACSMWLRGDAGEIVLRSWRCHVALGLVFLRHMDTYDPDPEKASVYPGHSCDNPTTCEQFMISGNEFVDGADHPDRKIGWWEQCARSYTDMLGWMFAYLMAKSVHIVEVEPSRQQRREAQRRGEPLKPWHVVRIEPKWGTEQGATGDGRKHTYRYDVIGHLRIGVHKLRDGTYREGSEWVPPHQRGEGVYLPKTYLAKGGRRADARTQSYFKAPIDNIAGEE